MAFTIISISRLDRAGYLVSFNKGMCTIIDPKSRTIATIPHSNGLYKILAWKSSNKSKMANAASRNFSISEAHRKLGHILHSAIKNAVSNGLIAGIDIDSYLKPTLAGLHPFLLGSPARCTFLSYFMCIYYLGSPARPRLSRSCSCPNRFCKFCVLFQHK